MISRFPTGLFILIALAVRAPGQEEHLQNAQRLFQQQQYPEALKEFEAARSAYPQSAAIENALGVTNTKLGQLEIAAAHYTKAIQLDPKLEAPHKNLGFNYLTGKQYNSAEKELKAALVLAPTDPYPHIYLAMTYLGAGRDREAQSQVKPAWSLLQNDPALAFELAKVCLRVDHTDEAMALVALLRKNPGLDLVHERDLATLLFDNQLYKQAVACYRLIAASSSASWRDRYNLAIALLNAKEASEATPLLEALSKEHSDDADIFSLLGAAYENTNKTNQALAAYRQEAQLRPRESDRYLDYTRLLMDLSRYEESERSVQDGLKLVTEPYPLYIRLGSVQMMASKYQDARASFQQAIVERPDIPVGYVALAQSYFKDRQDDKAAEVLDKARKRINSDYLLEYYYGLALDRLGRKEEAITAIKHAATLNSKIPDIFFELGKLYLALNQIPQARTQFENVIQMDPQNSKAYFELSRIYARMGDDKKAHQFAQNTKQLKQAEQENPGLARLRSFQPVKE